MRKLIWLPLESCKWRYQNDWARWFPQEFRRLGIDFITVEGECLTDKIELGSILDAYGTSVWKSTQLAKLITLMRAGEVTTNDTLLFADLWYPGLESLEYIACQGGQRPKITGILHAGSWDPFDFIVRTNMKPWTHELESAWFTFVNTVFVATEFHKDLILKSHALDPKKIAVTGLPFYAEELAKYKTVKDPSLVVFPHRLDPEKQPQEFDALIRLYPWRKWVKTAEVCKTKEDYYKTLAKATVAISFSLQETFGIAMLEAAALDCVTIVPDRLSYPELYPRELRYSNMSELLDKVTRALVEPTTFPKPDLSGLTGSISRMVSLL